MTPIKSANTTFQVPKRRNPGLINTAAYLRRVVTFANEAAYEQFGMRNWCISASYALQSVLNAEGYDAELLRVEAVVRPHDTSLAQITLGMGTSARPGEWNGHLVVSVTGQWLLDATLDQANEPEWGTAQVTPVAIRPFKAFWSPERTPYFFELGDFEVGYRRHHRQDGHKSKPAAKPGCWMLITRLIADKMAKAGCSNPSRQ